MPEEAPRPSTEHTPLPTIGIVGGTGRAGFGLAVRWAGAGRRVVLGSRVRTRAEEAARRIERVVAGARIFGGTNREAAEAGEVVVLTVPFHAHDELLPPLRDALRGKVVVDTTVALARLDPVELALPAEGASARHVQALLPEAKVVAALHTVSAHKLAQHARPLQEDTLLCGDDADAKAQAAAAVAALGLRPVDAGGLDRADLLERLAALVVDLNRRYRRNAVGVRFVDL